MKDLNYFIRDAKDDVLKSLNDELLNEVFVEMRTKDAMAIIDALKESDSLAFKEAMVSAIELHFEAKIDSDATENYRDYLEDMKAEADEQRYLARIGA